jgi:fused signal recognition particle receptor
MNGSEVSMLWTLLEWSSENPLLVALAVAAVPLLVFAVSELLGPSETPSARGAEAPPPAPPPEAAVEPAPPALEEAAPAEVVEPTPAAPPPSEAVPAPEAPAPAAEPERPAEPEPLAEAPPAAPVAPPVEEAPPPPPKPRVRLRDRLARTSDALVGRLGGLLGGRKVDAELLEELEALLFTADLGVATAESLLEEVRKEASGADAEKVRSVLRDAIEAKLARVEPAGDPLATPSKPHVVLVLGVNGSGKTTTIGKLAGRYHQAGKRVLLGAGDTFRAAAIEQLQIWGERVGCEVIATKQGSDPASVAFDAVKAAVARECDVAIIDTAGRLQTKKPLMEELGKIARVLGREVEGAPHESLLVLDANTGQNAISQARLFTEVAAVTGLVLTKLDGTAKGGVIVGLADEFGIPVKYVGVGEAVEDLRDFRAAEFVDALFEASA